MRREEQCCDRILPHLFVGNIAAIKYCIDNDLVDAIVSFNPREKEYVPKEFKGKVLTLKYKDAEETDILKVYNESKKFMRTYHKGLLIHCAKGHSRSVSLCILMLMKHYNVSYPVAYNFVKCMRPSIGPKDWFKAQLIGIDEANLKSNVYRIPKEENDRK
jgi:protein-tyrosine phosphatase